MEAVCSSDTLLSIYRSLRRCNTEDEYRHIHRRENLIGCLMKRRVFTTLIPEFVLNHRCRCIRIINSMIENEVVVIYSNVSVSEVG
jgi:hypothetical protein